MMFVQEAMSVPGDQIVANLFLCSWTESRHATQNDFVVNCTKDLPMRSENGIRVPVDDDGRSESIDRMFYMLPEVVRRIDKELLKGKRVVVHCLAGRQRSATVVTSYLMWKWGWELDTALKYVKSRRREAFFMTVNFQDALELFEKKIQTCKIS